MLKKIQFLLASDLIARETLANQVLLKSADIEIDLEKELLVEGEKFLIAIKR